jgi:hypothetical protein
MGKQLARHFSSLCFRLLISFILSAALYLGCWCCCSRWHISTQAKSPSSHVTPPFWRNPLWELFLFLFLFLLLACFNFNFIPISFEDLVKFWTTYDFVNQWLDPWNSENSPSEVFETLISQGLKSKTKVIASSKSQWFCSWSLGHLKKWLHKK